MRGGRATLPATTGRLDRDWTCEDRRQPLSIRKSEFCWWTGRTSRLLERFSLGPTFHAVRDCVRGFGALSGAHWLRRLCLHIPDFVNCATHCRRGLGRRPV